jgi:hypothetical protein
MNLKDMFGRVQADPDNRHLDGSSLAAIANIHSLAHSMPGGRPPNRIILVGPTVAEPIWETRAELPFTGDQVGLFRAQPGRPKRTGASPDRGKGSNGWTGGLICVTAIYLPSFLLLVGVLPFWDALRRRSGTRAALTGVNAAVVGLLLAALYTPVWTSAIFAPADFALGIVAFLLLVIWRVPPWLVVILGASQRQRPQTFLG